MLVLGVETSCDETGVALYHTEKGLLGECLYSQVETHAEYGGVVPELASRDHVRKLLPLLHQLLDEAELGLADLDAIAYTAGPGLIGALLVGVTFSQTLAWSLSIPALPVHHMEGHLLVPMLDEDPPAYPFVALLVSGGHTMLVKVAGLGAYEVIGDTLDDAVGEAFDKTAKLLGLGYPGGPALAAMASSGDPQRFTFPRPMTTRPGLDFSFSGLKTFARTCYEKNKDQANLKQDIAIAFELAVVDTLLIKCRRALKQTHCMRLVVAGGVGANQRLRTVLRSALAESGAQVFFPPPQLCTDNGVMIALAGALRLKAGAKGVRDFAARPRWDLARKHIEGG